MDSRLGSEMLAVAPGGATEEPLIEESVWGAVRALRERGLSKKQIGRELDLDIKTVRKWLRQKWEHRDKGTEIRFHPFRVFWRLDSRERLCLHGSVLQVGSGS